MLYLYQFFSPCLVGRGRLYKDLCILVSCNVAMLLFNITRLLASALWQKLWLQLDSSIICVCFFLTERLLLQKLLLASSINKVDHSLVKIKPYSFSLNLNRLGRMETSLTRRPLTIQATYRYSLCFSSFVMITISTLSA